MDGKEDAPLDAKSPYWMTIRMIGATANRPRPFRSRRLLRDALPKAFLRANPKSITVDWIDFYRN